MRGDPCGKSSALNCIGKTYVNQIFPRWGVVDDCELPEKFLSLKKGKHLSILVNEVIGILR